MQLRAAYIGQAAFKVRELFQQARALSPCILFIDEFEAIAPTRGSRDADISTDEIIIELLTQIDGMKRDGYVFILGATLYVERIDPAIVARLEYRFEIRNLELEQRQELFKMLLSEQVVTVDFNLDALATELAAKSDKMNGRAIRNVVQRASRAALTRVLDGDELDVVLTRQDLLTELNRVG
jgi:SpoVK/Ycf46/Vps4 family AAA+-type ATPase